MQTAQEPDRTTTPAERQRAFQLLFVCLVTVGVGNSIIFAVLPPLASEAGLSDLMVSVIYVLPALVYTITSQFWGSVSDTLGRRPVVLIGLTAAGASMLGFAAAAPFAVAGLITGWGATAVLIATRMVFTVFGTGTPAAAMAYVADRTAPTGRTAALATVSAGFGLGAALGPVFEGALAPLIGLTGPLYIAGAITLLAALGVRSLLPERTPPKRRDGEAQAERPTAWALVLDPRVVTLTLISIVTWTVQGAQLQTVGFYVIARTGADGQAAAAGVGWALSAGSLAFLVAQIGGVRVLPVSPRMATIGGAAVMALGSAMLAIAGGLAGIIIGFMVAGAGAGFTRAGQAGLYSLAVTPAEQGAAAGLSMATAGVGFTLAPAVGMLLMEGFGPASPYVASTGLAVIAVGLGVASTAIRRASAQAV